MVKRKTKKKRRKRLNDLSGKKWIKHSISWFTLNPQNRLEEQVKHPGKYPSELAKRFIKLFTKKGEWVIDPFAGVGSTLLACRDLKRNCLGIDINPKFVNTARDLLNKSMTNETNNVPFLLKIIAGDSMLVDQILREEFGENIPQFDLCMTSPPYWNMLTKSRGGSDSQHKDRIEKKLATHYSEDKKDLGNIVDYYEFLESITSFFEKLKPFMKKGGFLVVVLQNIRDENQIVNPLAWEFALNMRRFYKLEQEQIWCQTDKKTGIWGYPNTYVSNVHHHYCLIFSN